MATPPDSPIEEVVYDLEPSRLPKHRPVPLEDLCRQTKFTRQEIRVMYRGFKQRRVRLVLSKKQKRQSLFKRAEKLRGKIKFIEARKEIEIPGRIVFEPRKRKTGQDTTKPAPPFWPTKVHKALDELYRPNDAILGELEDEEDDMKMYEPDTEANPPWHLSDLSLDALQGFLQRESLVFLNAQYIPFELTDRMHQVLPTDVNYKNAILVIGEGVYWKRCMLARWPNEHPYPVKEGFSYKVLFVQHWFAEYLGELEPGYIDYSDVVSTTRIANPWVFRLNIKQLNAPKHKIMEPYNPFGYDEALSDVDADTCLKVRPYPKRLNLLKVLPHLKKLEELQICFGFINYERHPGFSHARMRSTDLELFSEALTRCGKLKSVRIYMSAFYSIDLKRMTPYLNKMRHLKRLEFSNCRLDDMGANIIARFLVENKTVRMISLKRNCITPKGIFDLSRTLAMPRKSRSPLIVLDLSFNIVSNLGAIYLACALLVNHKLVCLKLVGCDIGDVGGMALCYSVGINRCLGKLDLTANKLTNATAKVVIASLENNPNIEEIDVRGNDISEISLKDIMDLSKEKRMMRRMKMNIRRREVIVERERGAMVRRLRRDDVEKKRWAAFEDAGHSSTCSATDSGSITSLGSYTSGEIDEEEVGKTEAAASPPKAFHEL